MPTHDVAVLVAKCRDYLRAHGARALVRDSLHRAADALHERRLGIDSGAYLRQEELGHGGGDAFDHVALGYRAIYAALRSVPLPHDQVSFLDVGSGTGRVVAVAATFPFRRVRGVELSARLDAIARRNLACLRRRRAGEVELVAGDASAYAIPADVNVVHFFNPFGGRTLRRTVENLVASWRAAPRDLYVLYFNKGHFEAVIREAPFLAIERLRESRFYPSYSFGLYRLAEGAARA